MSKITEIELMEFEWKCLRYIYDPITETRVRRIWTNQELSIDSYIKTQMCTINKNRRMRTAGHVWRREEDAWVLWRIYQEESELWGSHAG